MKGRTLLTIWAVTLVGFALTLVLAPNAPIIAASGGLIVSLIKLVIAVPIFCGIVYFTYLLPWANARKRHHHNTTAILVFNVLLGWTFLGWVIALVWSCTRVEA